MEQIAEDDRNSSENNKSASEGNEEEDEEEEEKDRGKIVTATRTRRSLGPFQRRLMHRLADTRFTQEIDQTEPGHGGQENGNSGESKESATPHSKSDDDADDSNRVGESTTTTTDAAWSNTTLSDAGSDNLSLRDIDSPSASATAIPSAGHSGAEEDEDNGNSEGDSPLSEVDRIRRIHSTIFHSLAHDISELVRLREETMQFLEHGHTPPPPPTISTLALEASIPDQVSESAPDLGTSLSEEPRNVDENRYVFQENSNSTPRGYSRSIGTPNLSTGTIPVTFSRVDFFLRERLTFHARLARRRTSSFGSESGMGFSSCISRLPQTLEDAPPCTFTMNKYSYTPTANFANAPKATPAKPHLEVGVIDSDEKAAAANKILDKLQYGEPDDENACFVRRFWRETTTVTTGSPVFPRLSEQLAGLAERTASLEASLEEVFDGLRMRLEQVRPNCGNPENEEEETGEEHQQLQEEERDGDGEAGGRERNQNGAGSENAAQTRNFHSSDDTEDLGDDPGSYYESWDEETSILGNPMNYDIWDDINGEEGEEAGSMALARINLAERRAQIRERIRNSSIPYPVRSRTAPAATSTSTTSTSSNNRNSVGVGTDDGNRISEDDAEIDEESTDEDEVFYFQCCPHSSAARGFMDGLRSNHVGSLNQEHGELFHEIGIPEELGRDIMSRFSFSEEETRVPSLATAATTSSGNGTSDGTTMTRSEMPRPLFPRRCRHCGSFQNRFVDDCAHELQEIEPTSDEEEEKDEESSSSVPEMPLFDPTTDHTYFHFNPSQDDECSTRVYLDEDNLNFPIVRSPANHNDDKQEE